MAKRNNEKMSNGIGLSSDMGAQSSQAADEPSKKSSKPDYDRKAALQLYHAARQGEIKLCFNLLNMGVNPNYAKNEHGTTALMEACYIGSYPLVKSFLEHGAEVNSVNKEGRTALIYSSMTHGQLDTFCLLVSHGADVRARDSSGFDAFHWAARSGKREIIQYLVSEHNIDVNKNVNKHGATALIGSILFNHYAVTKLLVENYGADVNITDRSGYTPMFFAAALKTPDTVKLLREHGAHVNTPTIQHKRTPLIHACEKKCWRTAKYLIENGADVNAKETLAGFTPLLEAALNGQEEIVRILIQKGANVNDKTNAGLTALNWAAENGYLKTVELLIETGADLEIHDNVHGSKRTPLLAAVSSGKALVAKLLINAGANLHATDEHGKTAVDLATDDSMKNALRAAMQKTDTDNE